MRCPERADNQKEILINHNDENFTSIAKLVIQVVESIQWSKKQAGKRTK